MKKKIALFLAAALLSVGLIVSCGGGGDDDGDGPGTTPAGTQYTVSFDTDGGTPAKIESIKVDAGKTVGAAKWPDDPKKGDDTFKGWFEGATEYKSNSPINKNVALKAKWEAFKWPDPLLTFASFHPLGAFTNSNPGADTQRGWLFGEGGDDYTFTDNTWLLLETKGGTKASGFGGLQLTFIDKYEGDVGKIQGDLKEDWNGYNKDADEIIYFAIKLSKHPGYGTFKTAIASGSYTFFVASYPWTDLGFQNAYLVEEDLERISADKIVNIERGAGAIYGFIVTAEKIDWDLLFDTTFHAVTGITNKGAISGSVGVPLLLKPVVEPINATNKKIVWSSTSGTFVGDSFTPTEAGDSIKVKATIANGASSSSPFVKEFTLKISNLATAEFTVDLSTLKDDNDSAWEYDATGFINKTTFGGQYDERKFDLRSLEFPGIYTLDNYTKVSVKAEFYAADKTTRLNMTNYGIAGIAFITDLDAYTNANYPASDNYLYASEYNFGTIVNGVPIGSALPVTKFAKDGVTVTPEGFRVQKSDDGTDETKNVKWIKITEIKFLIDIDD